MAAAAASIYIYTTTTFVRLGITEYVRRDLKWWTQQRWDYEKKTSLSLCNEKRGLKEKGEPSEHWLTTVKWRSRGNTRTTDDDDCWRTGALNRGTTEHSQSTFTAALRALVLRSLPPHAVLDIVGMRRRIRPLSLSLSIALPFFI